MLVLVCVLLFMNITFAKTIQFTKLVDTHTSIPNGKGYFISFEAPYLYHGKIVFRGYGANKQAGVYTNINGDLSVVADKNTAIPQGKGNFIRFAEPSPYSVDTYHKYQILSYNSPALDDDNVIFIGEGAKHQIGVYLYKQNHLEKIADTSTKIPTGSGKFKYFHSPYLNNGNPAFVGEDKSNKQQGMYEYIDEKLTVIYDKNTLIPGSDEKFSEYWNPDFEGGYVAFWGVDDANHVGIYDNVTGHLRLIANQKTAIPNGRGKFIMLGAPSFQSGKVAFRGVGSNEQNGIYSNINGDLQEIASTNTKVPQGSGSFTGTYNPTIDNDNIVFEGKGIDKQEGIYIYYQGKLQKIINTYDQLDGKKIKQVNLGAVSLSGNQVAFHVLFQDGTEGIYLATFL